MKRSNLDVRSKKAFQYTYFFVDFFANLGRSFFETERTCLRAN